MFSQNFRRSDWLLSLKHGGLRKVACSFVKQIMLMNVLASGVLFLFIGPFEHVSSAETKETGKKAFICLEQALFANISPCNLGIFSVSARTRNLFPFAAGRRKSIFPCAK